MKDFIQEAITQHHIAQDLKLLRDLILAIMEKGYYPLVEVKIDQQRITRDENSICLEDIYGNPKLSLYTREEILEKGFNPTEFEENLRHTLNKFYNSSKQTINGEDEC